MSDVKWEELPKVIQEKMLDNQFQQFGMRKPEVFINCITSGIYSQGFEWSNSPERHDFWEEILREGNINHFYTKYPQFLECVIGNCRITFDKKIVFNKI